jgi:hypothetical protein
MPAMIDPVNTSLNTGSLLGRRIDPLQDLFDTLLALTLPSKSRQK